jgi:hypothetical protein
VTLNVQPTIERGKPVSFGVTYTVHGLPQRRALAKVALAPTGQTGQRALHSRVSAATVRPAVWKWRVTDTLPPGLTPGRQGGRDHASCAARRASRGP